MTCPICKITNLEVLAQSGVNIITVCHKCKNYVIYPLTNLDGVIVTNAETYLVIPEREMTFKSADRSSNHEST